MRCKLKVLGVSLFAVTLTTTACIGDHVGRYVQIPDRPEQVTSTTCNALGCLPDEPPPTVVTVPPVVATGLPPVPSSRFESGPAPQAPGPDPDPNGFCQAGSDFWPQCGRP